MSRLACWPCALLLLLPRPADAARAQQQRGSAPARHDTVRVFLDCNRCDEEFLRREVIFIDYVRNREDADVHVLVTTQETGSGGLEFVLKFIGLGAFRGVDETLTYSSPQTATLDERRTGFAQVFKLGLVRYAAETTLADRLRVTFNKPDAGQAGVARNDPWDYWVFRATFGGNFNGEQSNTGKSVRGSLSANRTTDDWRISVTTNARYSDSRFDLDEETTVVSVSRSLEAEALGVKSLTDHWSAGALGSLSSSTFRNYARNGRLAAGLEYDFFPYSQSSRRMLALQYTLGYDSHKYREETVFGKLREQLMDHRAELALSLRQPWGTAATSLSYSQYLTAAGKYSIEALGSTNVRLFKGFSFNVFGEFSRTRDQIYLPRGEATPEEILLRQRQLFTGYSYFINFGISYSFGSIFNNIVNPRFGGAGGFDF